MRFKVLRNGEIIVVTDHIKMAAMTYNKAIYYGKQGDIIKMLYREDPNKEWKLLKKDWL